jgi:hypothetical protein
MIRQYAFLIAFKIWTGSVVAPSHMRGECITSVFFFLAFFIWETNLSQIKARTGSEKDSLHVLQQSLEIALLSWNFTTIVPYMHVD